LVLGKLAKSLVVLIILGLVGYFFVLPRVPVLLMLMGGSGNGNTPIKPLKVRDADFSLNGIDLDGLKGDVIIRVKNPNPFRAKIDRLTYNFYDEDNNLIAKGSTSASYTIPADSTSSIRANIDIGWSGAASAIEDKITNFLSGGKTIWSVKGKIQVGVGSASFGIPYKTNFEA